MKKIDKKELHVLFKALKENDKKAYEELYEKYHELVYGIAFSLLKNKENTEDVLQTVFLKLFQMDRELLPTQKEASWLYTLVKNETLNYIRKQKKTVNIEELYLVEKEAEELNKVIDIQTYNKLIEKLNVKEREILSLKLLADMSFREMAQVLDMPMGTVQWKYYTSLHTLKLLLANLSMFAITFIVFCIYKSKTTKKEQGIITDSIKEENSQQSETNITIPGTEEQKESAVVKNETTENIAISELTIGSKTHIGLLSLASIFLLFTILFSIIFIKFQQKRKKKVSK